MATNRNGTKQKILKLSVMLLIAGLIVSSLALSVSAKEFEKIDFVFNLCYSLEVKNSKNSKLCLRNQSQLFL